MGIMTDSEGLVISSWILCKQEKGQVSLSERYIVSFLLIVSLGTLSHCSVAIAIIVDPTGDI